MKLKKANPVTNNSVDNNKINKGRDIFILFARLCI